MKPATFSVANIAERSSELEFELLCALAKSRDDDTEAKALITKWYVNVASVLVHTSGGKTQEELAHAAKVIYELWDELRHINEAKKAKLAVE